MKQVLPIENELKAVKSDRGKYLRGCIQGNGGRGPADEVNGNFPVLGVPAAVSRRAWRSGQTIYSPMKPVS